MRFNKLQIEIRTGDTDKISGLLPLVVNDFLLRKDGQKIGSKAEDNFNFVWYLTDENERGS